MGKLVNVTDETFAEVVLNGTLPVLVDFWAVWCGPCRALSPVLDYIAHEHGDKIAIVKMDVDANPLTPRRYNVLSIPTLILFQDGEPVKQILGAKSKKAILADLDDVITGRTA